MDDEDSKCLETHDERDEARACLALLKHFVELNPDDRSKVIELAAALRRKNH